MSNIDVVGTGSRVRMFVGFGFSDDRGLVVLLLVLFVFFFLVIIVVGVSRRDRVIHDQNVLRHLGRHAGSYWV
jgi:hypothetical protein